MISRAKSSYHPYLLVAFYLNCLPDDLSKYIPRSTKYGWSHKDQTDLFGYDWYIQNYRTFDTLQTVATNKKLMQINRLCFVPSHCNDLSGTMLIGSKKIYPLQLK